MISNQNSAIKFKYYQNLFLFFNLNFLMTMVNKFMVPNKVLFS